MSSGLQVGFQFFIRPLCEFLNGRFLRRSRKHSPDVPIRPLLLQESAQPHLCLPSPRRKYSTLLIFAPVLCQSHILEQVFPSKSEKNFFLFPIIQIWPDILRWKGFRQRESFEVGLLDPCMDTVVWAIFNTGPASSLRDLQVQES